MRKVMSSIHSLCVKFRNTIYIYLCRELQKLLQEEQRGKEQLEGQLKTHLANKTQCKILEAELEITKTRLKQAEEAAKETPPLLLSLQAEMAVMKKQHLNAIREVKITLPSLFITLLSAEISRPSTLTS